MHRGTVISGKKGISGDCVQSERHAEGRAGRK
jgi:hypothetical protein